MTRIGKTWSGTFDVEPGRLQYKFIVDGEWILDPNNKEIAAENGYNNSVVVVK